MGLRQNQDRLDEETKQMSKKRKKYTLEFERGAVQLWESSGKSAAEIEKDLGISTGLIYRTEYLSHQRVH